MVNSVFLEDSFEDDFVEDEDAEPALPPAMLHTPMSKNKNRRVRGLKKQEDCCAAEAIGEIFGSLIGGISSNPSLKDELLRIAIAGTALVRDDSDVSDVIEILGQTGIILPEDPEDIPV